MTDIKTKIYDPLPENFRKSPDVITTIDFIDTITGIAYKKFYLLGVTSSVGDAYSLTTNNTVQSDEENHFITGASTDTDFDIVIGKGGFTIAPEDAILVLARFAGTAPISQTLAYTVYHVNTAAAETSIGTGTGDTITGGVGATYFLKTQKIAMTEKRFVEGEKLRLNVIHTAGGADNRFLFDPSGNLATAEAPAFTFSSFILIPIKIEM